MKRSDPTGERRVWSQGAKKEPLNGEVFATVPKTDTGGREEDSQVDERTRVKELGKMHA